MLELSDRILIFLLLTSIQILVLGGLASIVVFGFHIRGKAAYWMYGLVVLLPFLHLSCTAIPPEFKIPLSWSSLRWDFVSWSNRDARGAMTSVSPIPVANTTVPVSIHDSRVSAQPRFGDSHLENGKLFLFWIWLTIVFALSVRLSWKYYLLQKAILNLPLSRDREIGELLQECASQMKLGYLPRLAVTNSLRIPVVVGFFHPTIVVPVHLLEREQRHGLRFTLFHEMSHLYRKDDWWLLPELLCKTVFFFHPMLHWIIKKLHEELEYLCDRTVVELTQQKSSYADFLLHESWNNVKRTQKAFALPFVSRNCVTARRVRQILSQGGKTMKNQLRNTFAILVLTILMFPLLLITFSPDASSQATESTSSFSVTSVANATPPQGMQKIIGGGAGYSYTIQGDGIPQSATPENRTFYYRFGDKQPSFTIQIPNSGAMGVPQSATDESGVTWTYGVMGMPASSSGIVENGMVFKMIGVPPSGTVPPQTLGNIPGASSVPVPPNGMSGMGMMGGGGSGMGGGMMMGGGGMGGMMMGAPQSATVTVGMGGGGYGMAGGMMGVPSSAPAPAGAGGGMGMMGGGGMGGGGFGMGGGMMMGAPQPSTSVPNAGKGYGMTFSTGNANTPIGMNPSSIQKLDAGIDPATLEVKIGNRIAKRGEDYLYDEKQQILVFLHMEQWLGREEYQIRYYVSPNQENPHGATVGGTSSSKVFDMTTEVNENVQEYKLRY